MTELTEQTTVEIPGREFHRIASNVLPHTTPDSTRPILQSVLVEITPLESLAIVEPDRPSSHEVGIRVAVTATDSYTLARDYFDTPDSKIDAPVSFLWHRDDLKSVLAEVKKVLFRSSVPTFALTGEFNGSDSLIEVDYLADRGKRSFRPVVGDFPNWRQLSPRPHNAVYGHQELRLNPLLLSRYAKVTDDIGRVAAGSSIGMVIVAFENGEHDKAKLSPMRPVEIRIGGTFWSLMMPIRPPA